MLFQSVEFIFLFLPFAWIAFTILQLRTSTNVALGCLVLTSSFFYGWHTPHYLLLIYLSISVNYVFGRFLVRPSDKMFLTLGITFNLGLLIVFKYADFITVNINAIAAEALPLPGLILPLAISFFTFQQIAYLVDVYNGKDYTQSFLRYVFFVIFFPQLIAGPIVHHYEILPQIDRLRVNGRRIAVNLGIGITIFCLGLGKKLLIADNVGVIADDVFSRTGTGNIPVFLDCWYGTLAYTFQIYFDFSGYSDMAVGLARMFGFRLPLNFYSPYKATSIIDFWRRWHMTLSRFLRDYLYIPLGGNRCAPSRRYLNVAIVMILGGLWHGAGWAFLFWGALHGAYLIINQLWQRIPIPVREFKSYRFIAWGLTFIAVAVAWVPFRLNNLETTFAVYREMAGFNGLNLGFSHYLSVGNWEMLLLNAGIYRGYGLWLVNERFWLVMAVIIALLAPNIYQWMSPVRPVLDLPRDAGTFVKFRWSPHGIIGGIIGMIAFFAIIYQSRTVEFLYFQF